MLGRVWRLLLSHGKLLWWNLLLYKSPHVRKPSIPLTVQRHRHLPTLAVDLRVLHQSEGYMRERG